METRGLAILARTMSKPAPTGRSRALWQYHSRGDRHSKAACWAILVDLLQNCPQLQEHVKAGHVAFGINHEMCDFQHNRKKRLDLVVCTPRAGTKVGRTLLELAEHWNIELSDADREALAALPAIREAAVGSVHCALEAKACMTAHIKAIPRLYDELNSSHQAIHGAADVAIAVGFVMVNLAPTFVSPGRQVSNRKKKVTPHLGQPSVTIQVIRKMRELPRRGATGQMGFDSVGVCVVDLRNDGKSPVTIVTDDPAPLPGDIFHYDQMISRVATLYQSRFPAR